MKKKNAFTLIELLVVVAIIAVLISMLLPALGSARESARKVVCGSNMGQVAKAIQFYAQDNKDCLPTYEGDKVGTPTSTFGNYTSNYGGVAKLVKRPSKVTTGHPCYTYYARGETGYLMNADSLFCPSDTVQASFRQKNPLDTHGWGVYNPFSKQYYAINDYNASGYWYIYVREDELSVGDSGQLVALPLFQGMKRYKVDIEDASKKFILWDIGHSLLVPTGSDYVLRAHDGWNVLYADGHVIFVKLKDMNHYLGSKGIYDIRTEFDFFDMRG
jgi:prepilin-type N-terminal cleavage/methylation domain-containing protein/prepilin-type processing-associated H-X9-DG protein